ncbi:MAG: cytochrome P450 [Anaerolineales bacterium]|nr:cytochrome P450 [Anaerolineales bacterium]
MPTSIPTLSGESGLAVLRRMLRERSILAGLAAMHAHLGRIFQITLPNFRPVFLTGPETNRHILVTHRHDFLWRTESDPVTHLLRHGLLVEDAESHDALRRQIDPPLQRGHVQTQIETFWHRTGDLLTPWQDGETRDMLVEMRKIALVLLMDALFGVDILPDLDRLWNPILRAIAYISPGPWIILPHLPRPGYASALRTLDEYLYGLIRTRRASLPSPAALGGRGAGGEGDLLTHLVSDPTLTDDLIRDQFLTLLIAGHDTSTAQLSWALYLLGRHPDALAHATSEARTLPADRPPTPDDLRKLEYLDMVLKETLRLYPPIHVGNRRAAHDMEIAGCPVEKDTRVMMSIYLSHRDPAHWPDPDEFRPERFAREGGDNVPPFTYIPFGGGPRNCVGAAFSQIEGKVVLLRLLQSFDLELSPRPVHAHMGATLEPRPGVKMRVNRTLRLRGASAQGASDVKN